MVRQHRSYDNQLKEYIVKLVLEEGHKMKQLSREMEIPYGTIKEWVRERRNEEKEKERRLITPKEYDEREKELVDRIKNLEEENEIIKKAAHIFAKNQK